MLYLATGNGILKFDTQSYQYAETPAMKAFADEAKRKQLKELRVLDILIRLRIEFQDAVASSQIEHPALETARIDTRIAECMFLKMAVAMITIIAVKTCLLYTSTPWRSIWRNNCCWKNQRYTSPRKH